MPESNLPKDFINIVTEAQRVSSADTPALYPDAEKEKPVAKWKSEVHYGCFYVDNDEHVAELERIRTLQLNDPEHYAIGREEWVHTKSGQTYVVLCWAKHTPIPIVSPDKEQPEASKA